MKNVCIIYDKDSWIEKYILILKERMRGLGLHVTVLNQFDECNNYDIVFMLSYSKIVTNDMLKLNKHNLVVHESNLPEGKGWSPLTWQILEGKNNIPITLFEAVEGIDSGDIYIQKNMAFRGNELLSELHDIQGRLTVELCLEFINNYDKILANKKRQYGKSTYYRRRNPSDSEIDINKAICEQFNLFRVVDNERYPAFFVHDGEKYILKIYKD